MARKQIEPHGNIIPAPIEHLAQLLARLPGVARRGSLRHAVHFAMNMGAALELGEALVKLNERVQACAWCGGLAAKLDDGGTHNMICQICADTRRVPGLLCIVAKLQDMIAIEQSGAMRGRYFILGALLSPLNAAGVEVLPIERLRTVMLECEVTEVIFATPPSIDGEATALVLRHEISNINSAAKVTRIATGIAHGVELEFADIATLGSALNNRRTVL